MRLRRHQRPELRVAASAGCLLACVAVAAPAAAQGQAPASSVKASETPWAVSCEPAAQGFSVTCQINKQLRTVEPASLVAQITVLVIEDKPAMRIIAPHELSIGGGLFLQVDGKDIGKRSFTTSVSAGIVSLFLLDEATLAEFSRGKKLRVFAKTRTGKDFIFAVSLDGFATGMSEVIR
jgi:invasion protein IalB